MMRTTDEQIREILKRSGRIAEKRKLRSRVLADAVSLCACAVLMIITAAFIPETADTSAGSIGDHYGSLILSTSYVGYVVTGLTARHHIIYRIYPAHAHGSAYVPALQKAVPSGALTGRAAQEEIVSTTGDGLF